MSGKPNPGSDVAIKAGCRCPVSDNARGMGAWGTRGDEAVFWIKQDCPLHGADAVGGLKGGRHV